ncbi:MAG: hypothetical protein KAH98_05755, partial [Dehalococcoidia bacterium]|nr:hypothetical protein [Dehalococcoidia bacterium]
VWQEAQLQGDSEIHPRGLIRPFRLLRQFNLALNEIVDESFRPFALQCRVFIALTSTEIVFPYFYLCPK